MTPVSTFYMSASAKKVDPKTHPTQDQVEGGRFYTRVQFAKLVGVSPWTLRHYQLEGYFCAFAQGKQGRGYASLYHESQINEFRHLPPRTEPHAITHKSMYTAQQAQSCFQYFDEGKSARYCVTKLGIHPNIVQAIMAEYAALDQGVLIPAALVKRINACSALEGELPVRTGLDVVELIELACQNQEKLEEAVSQTTTCPSCKSAPAVFCRGCVSKTTQAVYNQGCKETLDKVRAEMVAATEPQKPEGVPAEAETPPGAPAERRGKTKSRKT
jgi:hypothetical protein